MKRVLTPKLSSPLLQLFLSVGSLVGWCLLYTFTNHFVLDHVLDIVILQMRDSHGGASVSVCALSCVPSRSVSLAGLVAS
jgi:hypothetical protein